MSPRLYRGGLQWFEDPSNQPLCMEGNLTCESWSECSHGRSRKFCLCSVLGAAACWFRKASNTSPFSGLVLLLSPQKERLKAPALLLATGNCHWKQRRRALGKTTARPSLHPPDTGFHKQNRCKVFLLLPLRGKQPPHGTSCISDRCLNIFDENEKLSRSSADSFPQTEMVVCVAGTCSAQLPRK